jgi:NAD(P)-dependent dehydrogenase (short-subunit alcohol dehydrogenase family)
MSTLTDKVVLVTGVAMGCGKVLAEAFATDGAKVVGVDIDADGGRATAAAAKSAGGEITFIERTSPMTVPSPTSSLAHRRHTDGSTAR